MPLITLADARAQLNYDPSNTADDAEIQRYIDGVIGAVEDFKGEVIDSRSVTDELSLSGALQFLLRHTPVISLTSVQTVGAAMIWPVADLHVNPDTGLVTVLTGPAVSGLITVTYTAGYATPPARYRQAALIILGHLWETQRGASGSFPSLTIGQEETYDPRYSYSIPRRALELLGAPLPGVA